MNDNDDSDFAGMIQGVRRLSQDRVNVYRHRQRKNIQPANQETKNRSSSVYPSESAPARDSHFQSGLQKKLHRKIRQGLLRPEASLDLHGYRQKEALQAMQSFLEHALQRGMRLVIIVHGQGYRSQSDAVLKPLVQRWLAQQPQVLAWCPAQPGDGAAGASYVYLRAG